MSGKGCWLTVVLMFVVAAAAIWWVRQEEYRMINICVTAGATWDYQASQCRF